MTPEQHDHHFEDNILNYIILCEIFSIYSKIPLKLLPVGPVDFEPSLSLAMARHRASNKSQPEPSMINPVTMWIYLVPKS